METGTKLIELSGWGRARRARCRTLRPERVSAVAPQGASHLIARGQGRSYGDAATNAAGLVLLTERLNRFLEFDEETGVLRVEAGVTLAEVLDVFVPRGWFPAVTPGTKFVSVGGCVAADVHGKNHHRVGSFGAHVEALELVLGDGSRRRCSPAEEAELFWASVGGMGLTGVITEVTFRLRRVETDVMLVRRHPAGDLEGLLDLLDDPALEDEYTVCWVDCLARGREFGRGILITGNHARAGELRGGGGRGAASRRRAPRLRVPFEAPGWLLGRTGRAFNSLYFRRKGRKADPSLETLDDFFYPLDGVADWNRLYGKGGMVQYQCVVPTGEARAGVRELFGVLAASGVPSYMAVLKRLGAESGGLLSFPMPGHTLALDFPADAPGLPPLLEEFDRVVLRRGGRVYLAKDLCLSAESFARMEPRLPGWQAVKRRFDPDGRFQSDLSRRLGVTAQGG